MGKYKNLLSNTLLFAISTFSSKLLVFFLMPLYTRLLSTSDYGTVDLIVNTCNLIVPIIGLSIHEAVIRFSLEKSTKKSSVFSTAILTILLGYLLLLLCFPLLSKVPLISGYTVLIYLYVLTSAMRASITQFVRASGCVRMFAMDGVFTTVVTVALNVLFLAYFRMGVVGYVLATICADALSSLSLVCLLKLWRFFNIRSIHKDTARAMWRYSIPLMPTAVFWWVINLSDRYFVSYLLGVDVNGLYSVAYKIPTMIMLVSAIFTQAWQLSAFTEYQNPEGKRFFSTVFKSYYTFVFLAASGIILFIRPITSVLVSPSFFPSWRYVPFLVLAVSFSCLVTFLGSVYNAAKKNTMVTVTTLVGALTNLLFNFLLIPPYGAQGAAIATFLSFFLVFVIRAVDTRRYMVIQMQPLRLGSNLLVLIVQATVALLEPPLWVLWEILALFLLVFCNFGYILFLARRLLELLRSRSKDKRKALEQK